MRYTALSVFHVLLVLPLLHGSARANSSLPVPVAAQVESAAAICVGTVASVQSFRDSRDGLIYTRAIIGVERVLKGKVPPRVQVVHRGGEVEGAGEVFSLSPQLRVGERRMLFLSRRADGTLFASDGARNAVKLPSPAPATSAGGDLIARIAEAVRASGGAGADITDQAAPAASPIQPQTLGGLLTTGGVPSRLLAPDRGDPIPVLVDFAALPTGLTQNQATQAVLNALAAWTNVTSLRFVIEGFTTFPTAASSMATNDQKLRIQLHDSFGSIGAGTTLGVGGRGFSIPGEFPNGGGGGRVVNTEFHQTTYAYVVLKHTQNAMTNAKTFEEVLTHEVGHALGMDHSSESDGETNAVLAGAVMFYTAHADNRGAQLNSYDINLIRTVHPPGNTPPYGFNRVMTMVSGFSPSVGFIAITNPAINSIEFGGFDLQGTTVTEQVVINEGNGAGTFSRVNNLLRFDPAGAFGDSDLGDPENQFFARYVVRFSDGTNLSPPVITRVIALRSDTKPDGAPDGLPDAWMTNYFTNAAPVAGISGPNDDPDGDGLTNLQEFLAGTSPVSAASRISINAFDGSTLRFTGQNMDLYRLQVATTNLTNWTTIRHVIVSGTNGTASYFTDPGQQRQFFRVQRVP